MLDGTCHCGRVGWRFDGLPESTTACNCTLCRRYGTLWAYDYEGERISIRGPVARYVRADMPASLEIQFCPSCAGVVCWRGLEVDADGRRRIAVNLRLTEPAAIAHLPIDHFDGLVAFDDLPRDGRCVADLWF
ncbi:MAG: hypothetical protein JNK64_32850 [Myxococcales bacterium]|nr:hypothetical protein [Myxococcales bacterium]